MAEHTTTCSLPLASFHPRAARIKDRGKQSVVNGISGIAGVIRLLPSRRGPGQSEEGGLPQKTNELHTQIWAGAVWCSGR